MVSTVNRPDVRRSIAWMESADWIPWCHGYGMVWQVCCWVIYTSVFMVRWLQLSSKGHTTLYLNERNQCGPITLRKTDYKLVILTTFCFILTCLRHWIYNYSCIMFPVDSLTMMLNYSCILFIDSLSMMLNYSCIMFPVDSLTMMLNYSCILFIDSLSMMLD